MSISIRTAFPGTGGKHMVPLLTLVAETIIKEPIALWTAFPGAVGKDKISLLALVA